VGTMTGSSGIFSGTVTEKVYEGCEDVLDELTEAESARSFVAE